MAKNKLLTLVLVHNSKQILLGMKKRGFGVGRWNGFGGKVEPNETIVEAAKRELLEECCIKAKSLIEAGMLKFEFVGDPVILEVHVFRVEQFEGEPTETEEMRPQWFNHDEVPYKDMWPDDILWLPSLLQNKRFDGYFKFEGHSNILEQRLEIIEDK
ncbi:7,8-dihydro-8-oxoguanine triphosphatase-like [Actinia tenebrosa]|uniref:Oxidized purine nucleoside triphosphate hydrolase n=1 Tax=Actinia tenebrosa TaxID=6105 RepID=A0A6P8I2K7_ACTTE|nr:7,8-dihydro-8-oxoguanine triphosphatase-like [Actinia tenebrosa]